MLKKTLPATSQKHTEALSDLPLFYPKELKARTTLIIAAAVRTFPLQTQALEMCKHIISVLTPLLSAAIRNNELSARLTESAIGALLHRLLVHNSAASQRASRERELRRSDEWFKLLREIAKAEKIGGKG